MSIRHLFMAFCTVLTICTSQLSFASNNGSFFEGQLSVSSVTVVKNGQATTYEVVNPEASKGFVLSPQGALQIGRSNRCPMNLGYIESELQIDAIITLQYRDGGQDKDFNMIKIPISSGGTGKIIVPAGTRVWGLCQGRSSKTLGNFAFEPVQNSGSAIQIKTLK
jgi:hypothetical protein